MTQSNISNETKSVSTESTTKKAKNIMKKAMKKMAKKISKKSNKIEQENHGENIAEKQDQTNSKLPVLGDSFETISESTNEAQTKIKKHKKGSNKVPEMQKEVPVFSEPILIDGELDDKNMLNPTVSGKKRKAKKNKDISTEKSEKVAEKEYSEVKVEEPPTKKSKKNKKKLAQTKDVPQVKVPVNPESNSMSESDDSNQNFDSKDINSNIADESEDNQQEKTFEFTPNKQNKIQTSQQSFEKLQSNHPRQDQNSFSHKSSMNNQQNIHDGEEMSQTRVCVTDLGPNTTDRIVRRFFEGHQMNLVDVFLPNNGKPNRFAFVEFDTPEAASQAISMSGTQIDGSTVTIMQAKPRPYKREFPQQKTPEHSNILLVRGLGELLNNDEELRNNFENAKDIRVPRDQDGNPRGIAYVEYDDNTTAKQQREELVSQGLNVDFARPRNSNYSQGDRFGQNRSFDGNRSFRGGFNRGGDHRGRGRGNFQNNRQFGERRGFNFNDRHQSGDSQHGRGGNNRYFDRSGFRGRGDNKPNFNSRPMQNKAPRGTKLQFDNDE